MRENYENTSAKNSTGLYQLKPCAHGSGQTTLSEHDLKQKDWRTVRLNTSFMTANNPKERKKGMWTLANKRNGGK